MGVAKKTRKFASVKRIIGQRDARLKKNQDKGEIEAKKKANSNDLVREIPQVSSALFFQYNTALAPPYNILIDTNFLSHTVQKKLDMLPTMMDCLYAKCIPIITDCVMAELEKLGPKYRIALRIARDERWERLRCDHKGVYADDCIVERVMKSKIYIVATNDRELKRRIRKVPGVPVMSVARGKYVIERLPDAPEKQIPALTQPRPSHSTQNVEQQASGVLTQRSATREQQRTLADVPYRRSTDAEAQRLLNEFNFVIIEDRLRDEKPDAPEVLEGFGFRYVREDLAMANDRQADTWAREEAGDIEGREQTPSEIAAEDQALLDEVDVAEQVRLFKQFKTGHSTGVVTDEGREQEQMNLDARLTRLNDAREAAAAVDMLEQQLLSQLVFAQPVHRRGRVPPARPLSTLPPITEESIQAQIKECSHPTVDALIMLSKKQRDAGLVKRPVEKFPTICDICENVVDEGMRYKRCRMCEALRCKGLRGDVEIPGTLLNGFDSEDMAT